MNFKISPCNKQEYYLIANLEKSLFASPFSIKDLENMSLQEAFKIWKIYEDNLIGYVCFTCCNKGSYTSKTSWSTTYS